MTIAGRTSLDRASRVAARSSRTRPPTCPDENELVLLADGLVTMTKRAVIDRHLDACARCTRLVAELAGMAAPVRPVPGRYKVIRQLGAGAMGVVWEAEDKHLGRRVALKFIRADDVADPERRARLFREARTLAQLRHPNVVRVYDVGDASGELFLALELVIGTDARTWLAAAPRTADEILDVWRQAAGGLAAVHRAGIVHRDIKPDNIFVADDGRVLVGDFGLATADQTSNLTETGAIVGTPLYMAHEQLLGESASRKTDQYALCASMWEALAGERPFRGPTLGAIAMAMLTPPAIPARPDRHIFVALARGLDPNPTKRWSDVAAFVAALRAPAPLEKSRVALLAIAVALLAAAATIGVLVVRERTPVIAPNLLVSSTSDVLSGREVQTRPVSFPTSTTSKTSAGIAREARESLDEPVTHSDFSRAIVRATARLEHGEGGACLQILDELPSAPPVMREHVDSLRATCVMKAGDCAGGRKLLEATGRDWEPQRLAEALQNADFSYCPLEAPPRDAWPQRARFRLAYASRIGISCAPVLAFIAKYDIVLPNRHEQLMFETRCHVNVKDCAKARTTFRGTLPSGREAEADALFVTQYPLCKSRATDK